MARARNPGSKGRYKATPAKLAKFLDHLAKHKSISLAAKSIGLSRGQLYTIKSQDEKFSDKWNEVWEAVVDVLETALMERAIEGYDRTVFQQGRNVGTVKVHESQLGMFMLQHNRRDKYATRVEVTLSAAEYAEQVRKYVEAMDNEAKGV